MVGHVLRNFSYESLFIWSNLAKIKFLQYLSNFFTYWWQVHTPLLSYVLCMVWKCHLNHFSLLKLIFICLFPINMILISKLILNFFKTSQLFLVPRGLNQLVLAFSLLFILLLFVNANLTPEIFYIIVLGINFKNKKCFIFSLAISEIVLCDMVFNMFFLLP